MESKKRYCNQIKRKIVHDYMNGESVANLHSKYLVSKVSIYKWIKSIPSNESKISSSVEMTKIQKENERLKKRIVTLKKVINQLLNE